MRGVTLTSSSCRRRPASRRAVVDPGLRRGDAYLRSYSVSLAAIALLVFGLGLIAWLAARARASAFAVAGQEAAPFAAGPARLVRRALDRDPGSAVPRGLEQRLRQSDLRPGAGQPRGGLAAELRHAAPGDPQRGLCARHRPDRDRVQPAVADRSPGLCPRDFLLQLDRSRGRLARRLRRRRLGVQPHVAALPRPHPGRADGHARPAARLADRRPDHARHRPLLAVRELALLLDGVAGRVPVRAELEPAGGDPRRPGRLVGRVRRHSLCSGARSSSARSSP